MTWAVLSDQGPCKVSFARSDLRLWRPAAGVGPPESHLCPRPAWSALGSCPGQRDLVVDLAPRRPRLDTGWQPLDVSIRAAQSVCLTTLHEPWAGPGPRAGPAARGHPHR